jgi:hypothetical protein
MTTTRREFVTLGTIGLLGAKQLLAPSKAVAATPAAMPILAVGYWNGLIVGDGAENPTSRILSASSIGFDRTFSGASAMITTHGFYRAPNHRSIPLSLSLIAVYPDKTPFVAWNIALSRSGVSGALRSRFVVPVRDRHFDLAIDKHLPMPAVATSFDLDRLRELIFDASSIVSFGSSVGLQRGVYFVALRESEEQDAPNWTRVRVTGLRSTDQVKPDSDGILLDAGGNPVGFDYLVLKIDPYGVTDGRDDKAASDRRS